MKKLMYSGAVVMGLMGMSGNASAHEGDIGVELGLDGRLYTQLADEDANYFGRARIYESEFSDVAGEVYADEPGFQLKNGSLTLGQNLFLTIHGPLRVWNGSDAATFSSTSFLEMGFGPHSVTSPLVPGDSGLLTFPVEAGGGLHDHPDVFFRNAFDGVVIGEFSLSTDAAYAASERFWIIFGYNASEPDIEAAEEWVEGTLVPAPGAAALLGVVGVASTRRRRG